MTLSAVQAMAAEPLPLGEVRTWAYQIQALSEEGAIDALAATDYDLLVLEPTRTDWSSGDRDFDTRAMVARLKATLARDGVHRKLVIAYIDIGQAEDWRWYWTWSKNWNCTGPRPADWPGYILACDPDGWGGNYPVAYWDPRWKDLVIYGQNTPPDPSRDYRSTLDEVLNDGFDGVYLDWVEGFENDAVIAAAAADGKDPEAEMVAFLQEIRLYGKSRAPGFLVVQQNASALALDHPEIFSAVDAIAQEEVWYGGAATDDWDDPRGYDKPVDPGWTAEYLANLSLFQAAGLPVLDCDYALDRAPEAYANAYAEGFVPYCTRRALSRLTTTPPPGVCAVACSALVPVSSQAGAAVSFRAGASASSACTEAPGFFWTFGDGATSSDQNPSHTYAAEGEYAWALTVRSGATACQKGGGIAISGSVAPPAVGDVYKQGSPFRIVAEGSNFQEGIRVFISGALWPNIVRKDDTRLVLKGGSSLKAAVPKNTPTALRFVNPDGGEAQRTFQWP